MRSLLLAWLMCCIAWPSLAEGPRITMIASSTRVAVGEPFAVEIRIDLSDGEPDELRLPDFGGLEVIGQRVTRPTSFHFGFGTGGQRAQVQRLLIQSYTLRALTPGTYVIPAAVFTLNKRSSVTRAITIHAVASGSAPAPNNLPDQAAPPTANMPDPDPAPPEGSLTGANYDRDVFLRTVVSKTSAYVGEQLTVTVYLYTRSPLTQNPNITREPTSEGFWVQDLLPIRRTFAPTRQQVNNRYFNVYVLRRYAAFPLRAGRLEIGAPAIEVDGPGTVFDLLTGPSEPVRRSGVAVPLDILALPPTPGDAPVHVGALSLTASVEPNHAKVGDAVTLKVTAQGSGNLKGLKLRDPKIPDTEVLAPEIHDQLSANLDLVGGTRTFRWLILPRAPGSLVIPSFSVDVFDPDTKRSQRVRTAPLTLQVTGTKAPDNADAPTQAASVPETSAAEKPLELGRPRRRSALLRAQPPLYQAPWYLWSVLASPLLVLGYGAFHLVRKKLARVRATHPTDAALQGAEQRLHEASQAARSHDHAKVYGHLIAALRAVLQIRLREPVGGLTMSALREHCLEQGLPAPLTERVITELKACEEARFDPSREASESVERHLANTRRLVAELARAQPKEAA